MLKTIENVRPGFPQNHQNEYNLITDFGYDHLGHSTLITDTDGRVQCIFYDDRSQIKQTITNCNHETLIGSSGSYVRSQPDHVDIDENLITTFEYDPQGLWLMIIKPFGSVIRSEYNSLGQVIRTIVNYRDGVYHPSEPDKDIITNFVYDGVGNLIESIDHLGRKTHKQYNELNQLMTMITNYQDNPQARNGTDRHITWQYDYDVLGNLTTVTNPLEQVTSYTYNYRNQIEMISQSLDRMIAFNYNVVGNLTDMTDSEGHTSHYKYDSLNQPTIIDYSDSTPDVHFFYDTMGNLAEMQDGTGITTYIYDALYHLTNVQDGAGYQQEYGYDAVGNRTSLTYPDGKQVNYTYDPSNRLQSVTDWRERMYHYQYDQASRLKQISLPNDIASYYDYDQAGRLTSIEQRLFTQANWKAMGNYTYQTDSLGNRTETQEQVYHLPSGTYLEQDGEVMIEAEKYGHKVATDSHEWKWKTIRTGYYGESYLQVLPDRGTFYSNEVKSNSTIAMVEYPIYFNTPGIYAVWLNGMASSAESDSVYVELDDQIEPVSQFPLHRWGWNNDPVLLEVKEKGEHTLTISMREDGLRIDRLYLKQVSDSWNRMQWDMTPGENRDSELTSLRHVGDSTGDDYVYEYDAVGNRTQVRQNRESTNYVYDVGNRLQEKDEQTYTLIIMATCLQMRNGQTNLMEQIG
ncbi:MAG: hypothetical protein B6242_09790 [Anaerolineaceae bacterium 4572_78]|nr:MAG: hypothetical protein B6242_09790 [Anaerolineaceae bacterium 4572_78]